MFVGNRGVIYQNEIGNQFTRWNEMRWENRALLLIHRGPKVGMVLNALFQSRYTRWGHLDLGEYNVSTSHWDQRNFPGRCANVILRREAPKAIVLVRFTKLPIVRGVNLLPFLTGVAVLRTLPHLSFRPVSKRCLSLYRIFQNKGIDERNYWCVSSSALPGKFRPPSHLRSLYRAFQRVGDAWWGVGVFPNGEDNWPSVSLGKWIASIVASSFAPIRCFVVYISGVPQYRIKKIGARYENREGKAVWQDVEYDMRTERERKVVEDIVVIATLISWDPLGDGNWRGVSCTWVDSNCLWSCFWNFGAVWVSSVANFSFRFDAAAVTL